MKRVLLSLVLITSLFRTYADEGMWLPMLLGQQVYNDMVKRGLKLTKEQLYSINKASIKDAIIIFGGSCTGEIVSSQGLIFTNHHCGYRVIASSSSVEKNYLRDGFYAKTKEEEIPAQGLYVEFLMRMEDVTSRITDSLKGLNGEDRAAKLASVLSALNTAYSDSSKSIITRISPLFKGNQFLAFVYQRYSDIRLAGAPPESLGKFGGDTDNWEWPRHTADFSVFRAYMSSDGKPAAYSVNNIPLRPKYFLPVSIRGIKDGDYAMIYGYPGSTNRYETSYGVKLKTDISNPTLVSLRGMRLKYMLEEMRKDPATKLQLAPAYASIANYWKFYDGESKQLLKYNVYDQKLALEEKFIKWAQGKPEYQDLFPDLAKAFEAWRPYAKNQVFMAEGLMGSPLIGFAGSIQQVENALVKSARSMDINKALEAADQSRADFIKSENIVSDKRILASVLMLFYQQVDKSQHPIGFYESLKGSYGDLNNADTYKKYVDNLFSNTILLDSLKWKAFRSNPDGNTLQADPAYTTANLFLKNYQSKYLPMAKQFNLKNAEAGRLYLKGIMEMDSTKAKKLYPDATFTMRVSFGNVKSYQPRDAVKYDYATTLNGMLNKYVPDDYEFDLPSGFREAAAKKEFGQYMDKQRKDLVVDFITTNDITGGNSGSPVIDASGNLIGLAFDGNYEALSHKIAFDKDLNRTICVDIRFVLWCIDKLGGATNLIRELKLVKN